MRSVPKAKARVLWKPAPACARRRDHQQYHLRPMAHTPHWGLEDKDPARSASESRLLGASAPKPPEPQKFIFARSQWTGEREVSRAALPARRADFFFDGGDMCQLGLSPLPLGVSPVLGAFGHLYPRRCPGYPPVPMHRRTNTLVYSSSPLNAVSVPSYPSTTSSYAID